MVSPSRRRLPSPAMMRELLRPAPFERDGVQRRLNRVASIADLRTLARRRSPRAVFDYTDGAAGVGELALNRARDLFDRLEFHPTVLTDVSSISTETEILGKVSAQPFGLAPTGFTRMMHTEGERAVVAVAERAEIPYALSTMGTTTIEDVAATGPGARKWFQLYLWHDRAPAAELLARAAESGYDTLLLTADTPVGGNRLRDVHNGLTIPPQLTLRTLANGALHPHWWFDLLTTEPLHFASLSSWDGTVSEIINKMFDPAISMKDLAWCRENWKGSLVVKGVQSVADAKRVTEAGADGVLLSSHGGRQLDRAPVPLEQVAPVREALGDDAQILVDTGIMTGADIVACVAMGATAALVGRAYLYGLMAGGEPGVAKAVQILSDEVRRTMALLGVTSVKDLRPEHVSIRPA